MQRPSLVRSKLDWITAAATLLLATAPACSSDSAPRSNAGRGGGAMAGAAGTPTNGGTPAIAGGGMAGTVGTGGSAQGGMTGMASGGRGAATSGSGGGSGTSGAGAGSGGVMNGFAGATIGGGESGGGGAGGGAGGIAAAGVSGSGAAGAPSMASWCLPLAEHPQGTDWAKALIDSQIKANVSLTWQYPDGLFLHGVYLAYKRLNDASYFSLMKKFADANLAGKSAYNSLDDMQPSLVLDDMYRETKDEKYGTAPKAVAMRLASNYPKTSDGGFWHNTGANNQLWGDGVFMDLPPYVNYGELFGDTQAIDTATEQLIIYDNHLAAPNDLHVHQWDGSSGANGKQSCCEWCRAEGWYEMALLIVLDFTPSTHKNHAALVAIAERLAKGLAATQDSATGRWWQVMDKPNDGANWLETSCTAMHTYFLSKASQKGYIDAATYGPLAIKGFNGEMQMVSNPNNVQIKNICPGTGVLASPAEYYARPPATNDNHGLGAFLLMYDQLTCR